MIKYSPKAIAIFVFVLVFVSLASVLFLKRQVEAAFNQPLNIQSHTLYTIEEGQYAHFVINRFAEHGWIQDPLYFKAKLKLDRTLADIKTVLTN